MFMNSASQVSTAD